MEWRYCPNYSNFIRENSITGLGLLKMNIFEYKDILGVEDIKDIKLLMKSVDFLRIYVKLKLDFQDYIEYEKNETEKNEIMINSLTQQQINNSTKEIICNTARNINEKSYFGEEHQNHQVLNSTPNNRKDKSSKDGIFIHLFIKIIF